MDSHQAEFSESRQETKKERVDQEPNTREGQAWCPRCIVVFDASKKLELASITPATWLRL